MKALPALRVGLALALALTAAGCAPDPGVPPPPARHGLPRVASLNPCSDAILAEVADPAQIAALSHYSRDPRSSSMDPALARRFPATRGTVEDVLELRPDIVLGTSFTDPATARAYARLGLRLERIGIAHTVEESRAQVRHIAALVGQPARGEALVARIDRAIAAAAPPPGRPVPAVIWQAGGIVPGDDELIVDLMRRAGFANFAADRGLGQADLLRLEQVLSSPPEVLFIVGEGAHTGEGSDRLRFHPALDRLDAGTRQPLDPRLLYCGGPTIIAAAAHFARVRNSL